MRLGLSVVGNSSSYPTLSLTSSEIVFSGSLGSTTTCMVVTSVAVVVGGVSSSSSSSSASMSSPLLRENPLTVPLKEFKMLW